MRYAHDITTGQVIQPREGYVAAVAADGASDVRLDGKRGTHVTTHTSAASSRLGDQHASPSLTATPHHLRLSAHAMAPTPNRIAQTTSEVKKQYKQQGARLPEGQLKQLERAYELDVRAARLRDAQERRRVNDKKRKEKEDKAKAARAQTGIGLATQLIGYNHTQAQLKNGMEAFLGVKKSQAEEKRRHESELAKKLDVIAKTVEKEPWDDDDVDDFDLPQLSTSFGALDDDLDDETLLEAHDLVMSDPIEEAPTTAHMPPPPLQSRTTITPKPATVKDDPNFTRLHGPINKAIETILDKLPGPLVELLSQDTSLKAPEWDPAHGLLHKLNPLGLPPHRLRVKVGSVVTLLLDLSTSSQLSKSQQLRVLRAEGGRLECLVLDGPLEGTTTTLTRVPFSAKYRNDDQYPFQRVQFPIRIAADHVPVGVPRSTLQTSLKVTSISGVEQSSSLPQKPTPPATKTISQLSTNPSFKLPGLPASKQAVCVSIPVKPVIPSQITVQPSSASTDGWDDFLESGTQIARELCSDLPAIQKPPQAAVGTSPSIAQSLPPLSTQDFNFSMDDIDDAPVSVPISAQLRVAEEHTSKPNNAAPPAKPTVQPPSLVDQGSSPEKTLPHKSRAAPPSARPARKVIRILTPITAPAIDLSALRPSQRPLSAPDLLTHKRKATTAAPPPSKRPCMEVSRPKAPLKAAPMRPYVPMSDFGISTQEAARFFADDDDFLFGSPTHIV